MNFQPVKEPKVGKVRIHVDVLVDDLDAAVGRVVALGGADTGTREQMPRGRIAIMHDPEGNETLPLGAASSVTANWRLGHLDLLEGCARYRTPLWGLRGEQIAESGTALRHRARSIAAPPWPSSVMPSGVVLARSVEPRRQSLTMEFRPRNSAIARATGSGCWICRR